MNWIDVVGRLILAVIVGSLFGWLWQQSLGITLTVIGVLFLSSLVWARLFPKSRHDNGVK